MPTPTNQRTSEHLMNLIVTRNEDVPNFSLLLGSGASSTSGVRTAEEMIKEWRRLLFNRSGSAEGLEDWLTSQDWFEHDDEYSMLFETMYDQPSQRRIFIEERIKGARPRWGYVYLSHLISKRYFDVVFTTNFDDLLNEAYYLYLEDVRRPIVAAFDSAIQGIRVTSGRPKIIKLHGDFLYDNIKNTLAELETLETNTKRKLNQFAQEYGLVVLGYSGRDRSVMDILDLLLRDEENYRQGIYWCHRRGSTLPGRLQSLLRRDRVYLVEIDGFDEFTADLHQAAQLPLPRPIAQPLAMAEDRVQLFVRVGDPMRSHSVIGAHVNEVLGSINSRIPEPPLPIKATILSSKGQSEEAISLWEQAYREDTDNVDIAYHYADALADANRYHELIEFVQESPLATYNKTYFLLRADQNQGVVDLATKALSDTATIKSSWHDDMAILRVNRAIALKRLGRVDEMMADLQFLEQNRDTKDSRIQAGVAALRGNSDEMFAALKESLHESIFPEDLKVFPVFEDYRDDPAFLEFVRSVEE